MKREIDSCLAVQSHRGHILDGRQASQLADLMQPFPVEWEKQRELVPLACVRGREDQVR
jgi:hypothetical protein